MPASKDELVDAMHRIADALMFMRGPDGEVIFVGEKIPSIAWHLARAGCDVDADRAVIKARGVPNRPGQFAGLVDWVPVDWPDRPGDEQKVSAQADVDLESLDAALPWHVKTKFEGTFK